MLCSLCYIQINRWTPYATCKSMNGPPTLHTKSMDPLSYMQINRWTPYTTCKSINGPSKLHTNQSMDPLHYIQINQWTPKLHTNQSMDPLRYIQINRWISQAKTQSTDGCATPYTEINSQLDPYLHIPPAVCLETVIHHYSLIVSIQHNYHIWPFCLQQVWILVTVHTHI